MNAAELSVFQRFAEQIGAETDSRLGGVTKRVDEYVERVEGLVNQPVDSAWARIEKAARARFEKSGRALTMEQAVDELLATPAGMGLYRAYREAQATRVDVLEKSRNTLAARALYPDEGGDLDAKTDGLTDDDELEPGTQPVVKATLTPEQEAFLVAFREPTRKSVAKTYTGAVGRDIGDVILKELGLDLVLDDDREDRRP